MDPRMNQMMIQALMHPQGQQGWPSQMQGQLPQTQGQMQPQMPRAMPGIGQMPQAQQMSINAQPPPFGPWGPR